MNQLLRLPAVLAATGLTRSTLYFHIKQRLMTSPVKLGERASAWPAHEIEAINKARIAGLPDDQIRELVAQLEQQRRLVS
ncbi:MAG: AlpA family phage regulatory protein [Rhodocyclales bacterium]|nr:AlpA family phage regulatory protein [Rhodocyclales bacterium]